MTKIRIPIAMALIACAPAAFSQRVVVDVQGGAGTSVSGVQAGSQRPGAGSLDYNLLVRPTFNGLSANSANGVAGLRQIPMDATVSAAQANIPAGAVAETGVRTGQPAQVESVEAVPVDQGSPKAPGEVRLLAPDSGGGQPVQSVQQFVKDLEQEKEPKGGQSGASAAMAAKAKSDQRFDLQTENARSLEDSSLNPANVSAETSVKAGGSSPLKERQNEAEARPPGDPEAPEWYVNAVQAAETAVQRQSGDAEARGVLASLKAKILEAAPQALGVFMPRLQEAVNSHDAEPANTYLKAVKGWNDLVSSPAIGHSPYVRYDELREAVRSLLPEQVSLDKGKKALVRRLDLSPVKDSVGNILRWEVRVEQQAKPALLQSISEAMLAFLRMPAALFSQLASRAETGPDMSAVANMPGTDSALHAWRRARDRGESLFASFWIAARQFGINDLQWLRRYVLDPIYFFLFSEQGPLRILDNPSLGGLTPQTALLNP